MTVERTDDLGVSRSICPPPRYRPDARCGGGSSRFADDDHGIGHLQHKESDRVAVTADTLRRMGAGVEVTGDSSR